MHTSTDTYTALETSAGPGAVHDSVLACESELARSMFAETAARRALSHGLFLGGDSAYRLSPFLLKAYSISPRHSGASLVEQHVFNIIITRVRQKAEHINANTDSRWQAWETDGRFCGADWNTKLGTLGVWLRNFAITWQRDNEPAAWQAEQKAHVAALARDHASGLPSCELPTVDDERAARDDVYCNRAGVKMRDAFALHWTALVGDQVLIVSTGDRRWCGSLSWRCRLGTGSTAATRARFFTDSSIGNVVKLLKQACHRSRSDRNIGHVEQALQFIGRFHGTAH